MRSSKYKSLLLKAHGGGGLDMVMRGGQVDIKVESEGLIIAGDKINV